eukprot:2067465-Amphidinium_carterae.1
MDFAIALLVTASAASEGRRRFVAKADAATACRAAAAVRTGKNDSMTMNRAQGLSTQDAAGAAVRYRYM